VVDVTAASTDPADTTVETAPAATAAPTTEPPSTYTVAQGDSLSLISDRACMSVAALVELNGWRDGANHVIHPGDVVQVSPGACQGNTIPPVPADYTLPYNEAPTRAAASAACTSILTAYDTLFAGPPVDSTEEAARQWASAALVELRTAVEAARPPIEIDTQLGALEQGEPVLAATYVTFLRDTTSGEAYASMQAAADAVGLARYAVAIAVNIACPST
jgi:LysM repeat protein